MTQDFLVQKEWVSALADGQLRGEEFARTVELLAESEDARATWHAYHLVGDVLRTGELAASGARDAAFVTRLQQRLQHEAALTHPPADRLAAVDGDRFGGEFTASQSMKQSANADNFRWKLVAGLASLAAVSVLGWQMIDGFGRAGAAPQLAQQSLPTAVALASSETQQPIMIRDPRLDQLLAAHQQLGGTSALQMPAGFLRNATFEKPAR
jgi:sigma-E factor negative regulatory protein RseA